MKDEVEQSKERRFKILKFLHKRSYIPKITTVDDLTHHLASDPSIALTETSFLEGMGYIDRTIRSGNPTWMIGAQAKEAMERKPKNIDEFAYYLRNPQKESGRSEPEDFLHKNKKKIGLGSIFGVASILITIFGLPIVYDPIFPPEPEINVTDLNAKDGIIEGTSPIYSYEPRTLTPNGTKNEIFFLTVLNTGDGHAHNFWINIDSKPDGPWFDFHTSAVIHSGTPKNCQNKSSLCTIELVTKESGSIDLQYDVSFDLKQYHEIVNDTAKLFFKYGFDEGEDQEIEIFLKMD